MKLTAKDRKDFWFFYYFIPRHVKRPTCELSKYYNRFPKKNNDTYKYQMTLDDPFMVELAENINKKIGNKSDKYKAGYILKLVQMGYTYRSDSKTYGVAEKYQFPVCTSYLHIGDCEDGQLLGVGLCKLCGLDQAIVHVEGHLAYGVRVNGFGCKFEHEGKKYLWCESTQITPPGVHVNEKKVINTYTPEVPPELYIYTDTVEDKFNKYPL